MKLKEIIALIERHAPLIYQESYDNSGLQVGDYNSEVSSALVTLDVTEEVIAEAKKHGCDLIIAHHPVIFGGLKAVTGRNAVERIIRDAIRSDISIYAAHTNMDAVPRGVNGKIAEKLGLQKTRILEPVSGKLKKLVVFVPSDHAVKLRDALFGAGAGVIGNYDSCSYNLEGKGTFRGGEDTDPFVGKRGELHMEPEVRVETVFPAHQKGRVITAMLNAHPYEEVAYDIYPLENRYPGAGSGMIGELPGGLTEKEMMELLKDTFRSACIRHSAFTGRPVKKVALCGGAGSHLLGSAISAGADLFLSGDFKYHQFFDADGKIVIADIGHFESEQFTRELFYDLILENFPKFAIRLSDVNTNPIKYF